MVEFFPSKIFNNGLLDKAIPIYSILSDQDNFSIDDIPEWCKKHKFENIFIITNGQQTHPTVSERNDIVYGRSLTGTHLEKFRTYKICKQGSLASFLYEKFHENSLIITILDSRYNWESSILDTTIPVNFIFSLLHEILGHSKQTPKIILTGFSRGASFTLELARWMKTFSNKIYAITVDPVAAKWKHECQLSDKKYPILPNPGCPCWNIFQRQAFLGSSSIADQPVGSAVQSAKSLRYLESFDIDKQFDKDCRKHIQMSSKYIFQILKVINTIIRR